MEAQQGRQRQQEEVEWVLLWELQLAAAGVELEVWAASEVEVGTEQEEQLAGAGVFQLGAVLKVEDLQAGQEVWPVHWEQVLGLQGGCLGLAEGPRDAPLEWAWVLQGEREVVDETQEAH